MDLKAIGDHVLKVHGAKLEAGFEKYWAQTLSLSPWPRETPQQVRHATKELARTAWIVGRVEFIVPGAGRT